MNMDAITLEDCLINFEVNNQVVIINDGHIIRFEDDKSISLSLVYYLKDKI